MIGLSHYTVAICVNQMQIVKKHRGINLVCARSMLALCDQGAFVYTIAIRTNRMQMEKEIIGRKVL